MILVQMKESGIIMSLTSIINQSTANAPYIHQYARLLGINCDDYSSDVRVWHFNVC